jgi:hypothetical protein
VILLGVLVRRLVGSSAPWLASVIFAPKRGWNQATQLRTASCKPKQEVQHRCRHSIETPFLELIVQAVSTHVDENKGCLMDRQLVGFIGSFDPRSFPRWSGRDPHPLSSAPKYVFDNAVAAVFCAFVFPAAAEVQHLCSSGGKQATELSG